MFFILKKNTMFFLEKKHDWNCTKPSKPRILNYSQKRGCLVTQTVFFKSALSHTHTLVYKRKSLSYLAKT